MSTVALGSEIPKMKGLFSPELETYSEKDKRGEWKVSECYNISKCQ